MSIKNTWEVGEGCNTTYNEHYKWEFMHGNLCMGKAPCGNGRRGGCCNTTYIEHYEWEIGNLGMGRRRRARGKGAPRTRKGGAAAAAGARAVGACIPPSHRPYVHRRFAFLSDITGTRLSVRRTGFFAFPIWYQLYWGFVFVLIFGIGRQ